jgi:hypothetical protein
MSLTVLIHVVDVNSQDFCGYERARPPIPVLIFQPKVDILLLVHIVNLATDFGADSVRLKALTLLDTFKKHKRIKINDLRNNPLLNFSQSKHIRMGTQHQQWRILLTAENAHTKSLDTLVHVEADTRWEVDLANKSFQT